MAIEAKAFWFQYGSSIYSYLLLNKACVKHRIKVSGVLVKQTGVELFNRDFT